MTLPEALRALHEAGKLQSPWLAGMLLQCRQHPSDAADVLRIEDGIGAEWPGEVDFDVRLDDPATLGCLLALFREASARPCLCLDVHWANVDGKGPSDATRWCAWDPADDWEGPHATTEGGALSAALVKLALEGT